MIGMGLLSFGSIILVFSPFMCELYLLLGYGALVAKLKSERYSPLFAALVSRQYVDMSRIRIEGLLATFPKLVGIGKQHTYVETDTVRYVYQPMESLYLLLVTNKQSNILEDRDTLQLLSKLVSSKTIPDD
jgi:hypothetical protein